MVRYSSSTEVIIISRTSCCKKVAIKTFPSADVDMQEVVSDEREF
jgi:hypothetical protein